MEEGQYLNRPGGMKRYSKEFKGSIIAMIEKKRVKDICKENNLPRKTFYNWLRISRGLKPYYQKKR